VVDRSVPLCPHCSTPAEQPLECARCGWRWYANPLPAAGVLIEREVPGGEPAILLLRRAVEPGFGDWDLPAGYLDPNESVEEAALREAREESGLEVELVRLIGVYTSRPANAISAVYLARQRNPADAVALDDESSAFAWVARDELPGWLPRMAFASMRAAVEDWAEGRTGVPRDW
jgi:ADP-ribose pyrophosphatase YjhB (NUDIX family)